MDEETINEIVQDEQTTLDYFTGYSDGADDVRTLVNNSKQKWWKSKALWISFLSLLGIILVSTTDIIDNDLWQAITTLILTGLSTFGIINSPNTKGSLG